MAAWGFDQLAAEAWMAQNMEETGDEIRRRETPLDWDTTLQKIKEGHRNVESRLSDKSIPR